MAGDRKISIWSPVTVDKSFCLWKDSRWEAADMGTASATENRNRNVFLLSSKVPDTTWGERLKTMELTESLHVLLG